MDVTRRQQYAGMLTDRPAGSCLTVETVTALYCVCLRTCLVQRSSKPEAKGPYRLVEMRGDGAAIPLYAVVRLQPGQPMILAVGVLSGVTTIRTSTPVLAVNRHDGCGICQSVGAQPTLPAD